MTADILTIAWKEVKELLLGRGTRKGTIPMIAVPIFIQGIWLPWQIGRGWIEQPLILMLWSWMPAFLVATIVADAFAGERERHTLETLLASRISDRAILFGKLSAAIAYGWGITVVSMIMAVVVVNLKAHTGGFIIYSRATGIGSVLLSFLAAGAMAGAGVFISLRASTVKQAQQTLSVAVMVLLFGSLFGYRALPAGTRLRFTHALATFGMMKIVLVASAVLLIANLVLIGMATVRFQRSRLILS